MIENLILAALLFLLILNISMVWKNFKKVPAPKKKKKVIKQTKKTNSSAKNSASVLNASVDFQKIRTAEIEIPVIAEDVLVYEGGELGPAYPERTRLFYSKEAISDPEYLETVKRSPLQMGTHEKNTAEFNRDVDGWPIDAWWDDSEKRVKVKGVLHGEENVKYAEENKNLPGFGTSAFISFLKLEKASGTAPNGKPYDAIVRKAVNNHIAILPNIRDTNNTIVAMNNKVVVAFNAVEEKESDKDDNEIVTAIDESVGGKIKGEKNTMAINKDEFKEMYNTVRNEEKEEADKAEKLKNEIKNELEKEAAEKKPEAKDAKNDVDKAEEEETKNAEDKEDKAEEEASNAIPSDEMLKDFSTHLGIAFPKAPTLKVLGKLVGVEAKNSFELITALNAKRKEFNSGKTPETEVTNSNVQVSSMDDLMKKF